MQFVWPYLIISEKLFETEYDVVRGAEFCSHEQHYNVALLTDKISYLTFW